jgi:hypothetical protein
MLTVVYTWVKNISLREAFGDKVGIQNDIRETTSKFL